LSELATGRTRAECVDRKKVLSHSKSKWWCAAIWLAMHGEHTAAANGCCVERKWTTALKKMIFLPLPIITPSTKAEAGHDEDISPSEIISKGLATEEEWQVLSNYALQLFARGKEIAARHGLILADTKYEFGKLNNEIVLMDEVHTPDSSRYFYADGFQERQAKGERQKQLSKEFVREWLIANNFMGKEGQTVPEMSDDWVDTISRRYIELYETVIGEKFIPQQLSDADTYNKIVESLNRMKHI
jgi:phosphoribosylaminoimidazole-succinocarboxamide synthase